MMCIKLNNKDNTLKIMFCMYLNFCPGHLIIREAAKKCISLMALPLRPYPPSPPLPELNGRRNFGRRKKVLVP